MAVDPKAITAEFLKRLGFEATVTEQSVEEMYMLQIETDDPGRLIGRQGKTLSEFQYLINKMVHTQDEDHPRVTLDVGGYRSRIREALIARAKAAAEKVRRWGDIIELEPMNAFDRWVVHNALKHDQAVETRSVEVDGTDKKAVILRPRR
ncbi:MAG: KH domain-containing protein [Verrucomicrobia bacterium]|nr:KH domain-containing protein [Verrucomicrobiota bacterium]